jgi:signal transduction histidine kinase/glycopeptide antibiotics resistance protein
VHGAVEVFTYINRVAYIALGIVVFLTWYRRRDRASLWAAAAFGSLALLEVLSFVPNHPGNLTERALGRVAILLFVVFPYLLYRFTNEFRATGRRLANLLFIVTAVLIVWTIALPSIPQPGEGRSPGFQAFVLLFFVHWTVLSIVAATSLWRAGRAQPTVARRRMRFLAIATALLNAALLLVIFQTNTHSALALSAQVIGAVSVVAFLVAFVPPQIMRIWWRSPEQRRLQEAIAGLLTFAETQQEVASRVLEPAAAIVGAHAIAIRNAEGAVVGAWNVPADLWDSLQRGAPPIASTDEGDLVDLEVPGGSLVVWTSRYAPFFGDEELRLLSTLGALIGLALDRVTLYQREHEARLELERTNEVMTSFIALAAHELRTPMTTIHGFVTTLHHLGDRLDDEQKETVSEALVQQTHRMANLVEQLLDLSRLDAAVIEIAPEPVHVRSQVEEIVSTAVADRDREAVKIDVPNDAVAVIDKNVLDRILSNLVTNAFRYGEPPVRVSAERRDNHLRVCVEDSGHGVAPEFVPNLFERFTRSEGSRASATGTGLGLAIARSYARAHGGDLVYEDAEPHGARFNVILPVQQR